MGIELHYAAGGTFSQSNALRTEIVLSAKSALPAVDEPPTDVLSSSRYRYFCVIAHVASLITATRESSACRLFGSTAECTVRSTCMETMPRPQEIHIVCLQ